MDRKFEVGERCRIVHVFPGVFFDVGDVVEVKYVSPNTHPGLPYCCRRISDDKIQYVDESQLAPVESTAVKHSFKVGDWVRIIDHRPKNAYAHPTWTSFMDEHVGKVGKVIGLSLFRVINVNVDGCFYNYRPEWLIPIAKPSDTLIGNLVIPKADGLLSGLSCSEDRISPTDALPLIETNKLLTDIKLD